MRSGLGLGLALALALGLELGLGLGLELGLGLGLGETTKRSPPQRRVLAAASEASKVSRRGWPAVGGGAPG